MFINRYLAAFVRGHGGKIVLTCFLQLVLTLMGTLISLGAAFVARMLQGEGKISFFKAPWQMFACIAILIALRYVLMRRKALASEQCSLSIKTSLRDALLHKLFSLGPAYTGKERTGALASTIFNKVEYLNEYYTIYLPAAVAAIVNAALIIAVLCQLNSATAGICILACIGMLGCPMIFYFLMRERGEKEMQAHSQYYSDCLDSVQGMATLKAFNANGRQRQIIHDKGELLRQAVMGQLRVTMLENVVLQFFAGLGSAISIAVAAWQCASGVMAQGKLSLDSLRDIVTVVPQDVYLFNVSVEENLRLARLNATKEEIRNAAKQAQADAFIGKLPSEYDTPIGERGLRLSGGEKQRLSIAQAFLKNTPVLVLDEASANLDAENERLINQAVEHLKKGRATLVIAHRISTIRSADRIVAVKDGTVVGKGTYAQLMASCPYFRKLIGDEYESETDD